MKEYTLLAFIFVFAAIAIDRFTRVRILRKGEFAIFLFIVLLFKLLVNGYLTGQNIVIYDPRFFLGLRIGSIPLEDFLFGFSMVTMTIIFWEYFKQRSR